MSLASITSAHRPDGHHLAFGVALISRAVQQSLPLAPRKQPGATAWGLAEAKVIRVLKGSSGP